MWENTVCGKYSNFRTPPTLLNQIKEEFVAETPIDKPTEKPTPVADSGEPPVKKHKKHKRDKNRHFETEQEKAEYVIL
jgi:hypothetical protein